MPSPELDALETALYAALAAADTAMEMANAYANRSEDGHTEEMAEHAAAAWEALQFACRSMEKHAANLAETPE